MSAHTRGSDRNGDPTASFGDRLPMRSGPSIGRIGQLDRRDADKVG